jgi:predicted CopG family antitoxin
MTQENRKQIAISDITYSRLRELGASGESFNTIIGNLIDKSVNVNVKATAKGDKKIP